MNIILQKQAQELQEIICKIHNMELIATDSDNSDKSQIKFYCGRCLVDKINNMKVAAIKQSQDRISQIKVQQQEIKTKENQARLIYYKNILNQIVDFKRSIDVSLDKIYKKIQQYIFAIQKEIQELQEYQQQLDCFEDINKLSELYYSSARQKSNKLDEDNNFIDEITRQFELLFNNAEYFQTLDTLKNTKQTIQDFIENNVIELPSLLSSKNDTKTPSLNKICISHNKEIIMIDMDSQKKNIYDRLACVDCISQNSQIKYKTIENVNKQWLDNSLESEKILQEYKKERKNKKSDLLNQIAQMRKNYNQKLNEISEQLIEEQFQFPKEINESKQIEKISILNLEDEQLLEELKKLIENQQITQDQFITSLKDKDQVFRNEIENNLESLQQSNQQDIYQSLFLLQQTSIERKLIVQLDQAFLEISTCTQNKDENYEDQIEIINDIQELVDQAKKYQCSIKLFEQIITLYQQHHDKLDKTQQKIAQYQMNKLGQINSQYQNLSNVLNDYTINIDMNSKELKKYCDIQKWEIDLFKLKEMNKNQEIESNFENKLQLFQKTLLIQIQFMIIIRIKSILLSQNELNPQKYFLFRILDRRLLGLEMTQNDVKFSKWILWI